MCSKNHSELKRGPIAAWLVLKLVGVQITPADEYGPREELELRDCSCGSTLSRVR